MKLSIKFLIVLATIIILGILTSLYFSSTNSPIINPSDLYPALVSINFSETFSNNKIGCFQLINQNGEGITAKDYRGKIYVTNFIFQDV